MSDLDAAIEQLVTANRIVAHENVCDSYGHVRIPVSYTHLTLPTKA